MVVASTNLADQAMRNMGIRVRARLKIRVYPMPSKLNISVTVLPISISGRLTRVETRKC